MDLGHWESSLIVDATPASAAPEPRAVDPTREYVSAPGGLSRIEEVPFGFYEPFHRRVPQHMIPAMLRCPAIKSSVFALKSMVLSGGFQLTPALAPSDDDLPDPEEARALTILEECKRARLAMEVPLEVWAWEMLDAACERDKLAEIVLGPNRDGVDRGKYGIRALKCKPRWSYRYRADEAMNVRAIDAYTVDGEWAPLDPDHFCWLSWDARNGDPRGGDSLLDAAYHAFNLLMQLWPEFALGNRKWGTPSLFMTSSPHSKPMVPPRDRRTGAEIPGARPVTAEYAMAMQGDQLKNGSTVCAPPGATAEVIESARGSEGIESAIRVLEAQCVVCILLQTRMTREAQHGSRADSETGSDVAVSFAQHVRSWLCEAPRKAFRAMVRANYDDDTARRLTPHVGLGQIDPRNFAAIAQAVGLLYQSGYFTERQMLWLDAYLGLPQRRPGDLRIGPQKDAQAAPGPGPDAAMAGLHASILSMMQERGMPGE